MKTGKS